MGISFSVAEESAFCILLYLNHRTANKTPQDLNVFEKAITIKANFFGRFLFWFCYGKGVAVIHDPLWSLLVCSGR